MSATPSEQASTSAAEESMERSTEQASAEAEETLPQEGETPQQPPSIAEQAEEIKRAGNELFATRRYEEAIEKYDQAIRLDDNNAVLYSNRSACFAALKKWQQALYDAATSISKDAGFIKAYYRLATAQSELGLFEDAMLTLQAALAKEPVNEQITKQMKVVQAKKSGTLAQKPKKVMSEGQRKEAYELQEQTAVHVRDLKTVQARLTAAEREARSTQATMNHVAALDRATPLYRSVGKAFFLTEREDLVRRLEGDGETLARSQRELTDKQEYLERRINSNSTNLRDLMAEYAF